MLILFTLSSAAGAQAVQDDDDLQQWNDVEFNIPVNKKVTLNTVTTLRLDENISNVESYRFSAGATFKLTKAFSVAPFMTFISARRPLGNYRYEYRPGIKLKYRFPVKVVSVSHTSRFEHRSRPGRDSWRYRPSVTIEKNLPEKFLKDASVFVTDEPFYDSVSGRFARNRISGGIRKSLNKKFAVEFYYLYQGDNFSSPGSIHVLGTGWKITL